MMYKILSLHFFLKKQSRLMHHLLTHKLQCLVFSIYSGNKIHMNYTCSAFLCKIVVLHFKPQSKYRDM